MNLYEIYISDYPMDIYYLDDDGKMKQLTVEHGVAIIPPGLYHDTKFQRYGYVIKVLMEPDKAIHRDKERLNIEIEV